MRGAMVMVALVAGEGSEVEAAEVVDFEEGGEVFEEGGNRQKWSWLYISRCGVQGMVGVPKLVFRSKESPGNYFHSLPEYARLSGTCLWSVMCLARYVSLVPLNNLASNGCLIVRWYTAKSTHYCSAIVISYDEVLI
jgi:hypothetical protein